MGIAYRIIAKVEGVGSSVINQYLQKWQLTDVSGEQTDQISLTVAAPDFDSLPTEGKHLTFYLGIADYDPIKWFERGQYTVTRITPQLFRHTFNIVATAAPFQVNDQTEFKQKRSETYSETTVGDVFRKVVKRHGLSPRVDPELDSIPIQHIDQVDETDMSFLTRLARQHSALAKPIDKLYVLGRRGNVKNLSGKVIEPLDIKVPTDNRPASTSFVDAKINMPSRQQCKGIKAKWWNDGTGEEVIEQVGENPFLKLSQVYPSQSQAIQAATDELRKVKRTGTQLVLNLPASPGYFAEGVITTGAAFPKYAQGNWSIDRVVMSGGTQAARAQVTATLTNN